MWVIELYAGCWVGKKGKTSNVEEAKRYRSRHAAGCALGHYQRRGMCEDWKIYQVDSMMMERIAITCNQARRALEGNLKLTEPVSKLDFALFSMISAIEDLARMVDEKKKTENKLLNEAYVFLGMPHKALNPWRIALDEWKAKVELETGWNHFEEVGKNRNEY